MIWRMDGWMDEKRCSAMILVCAVLCYEIMAVGRSLPELFPVSLMLEIQQYSVKGARIDIDVNHGILLFSATIA